MTGIRDTATVTVSEPVDGTRHIRGGPKRTLATTERHVVVHPLVMAAAHRARREGQRLVIVSATEVLLVNG